MMGKKILLNQERKTEEKDVRKTVKNRTMLDPKEFAYQVFEKHFVKTERLTQDEAKEHAIIDVQNTIDALEYMCGKQGYTGIEAEKLIEHFNQVKEHIKQL